MHQYMHKFQIETRGKGFYDITPAIDAWVRAQRLDMGLLTLFVPHTTASLIIQENADPDVLRDLADFFARLVPEDGHSYRHAAEGPDDMPSHIRTALTQTHLSIPIQDGEPTLGPWQNIYLCEHRARAHRRTVIGHMMGD